MKIYCYSRCSTCKKALKYLDEKKIVYELIDLKTDPPTFDEMKSIYEQSGLEIKKFFNTSEQGDVRITFNKVMPADISLIAKVNGSTFEEYTAKNGKSFSRLEMGEKSADNMFQHAHDENRMFTWILRLVGLLLVVFGLKSMFSILPTLFKVLPFLADIVNLGVGLVCAVLGFVWSFLVIGVAWLFYRPVLGIILIVLAVGGIIFLKKRSKKRLESSSAPLSKE